MSDDQMLNEHKATFNGFIKGSIYLTVVIAIVLLGMAAFLV